MLIEGPEVGQGAGVHGDDVLAQNQGAIDADIQVSGVGVARKPAGRRDEGAAVQFEDRGHGNIRQVYLAARADDVLDRAGGHYPGGNAAGLGFFETGVHVLGCKGVARPDTESPAVALDAVEHAADHRKLRAIHVLEDEGLALLLDLLHDGRHLELGLDSAADAIQLAALFKNLYQASEIQHVGGLLRMRCRLAL